MKALYPAIIVILLFLQCKQETISGTVVKVADGDTFTLLTADNHTVKIRLHGIDAPEKGQDFYRVSRDYLASITMHQRVEVIVTSRDRYKRTVGLVSVNGTNVNEAMLRSGLAWHYREYDKKAEWSALEKKARAERAGLWKMPHPVPPWQFRKARRSSRP